MLCFRSIWKTWVKSNAHYISPIKIRRSGFLYHRSQTHSPALLQSLIIVVKRSMLGSSKQDISRFRWLVATRRMRSTLVKMIKTCDNDRSLCWTYSNSHEHSMRCLMFRPEYSLPSQRPRDDSPFPFVSPVLGCVASWRHHKCVMFSVKDSAVIGRAMLHPWKIRRLSESDASNRFIDFLSTRF